MFNVCVLASLSACFSFLVILQLKDHFYTLPRLYSDFKVEIMAQFCTVASESISNKCSDGGDICRLSLPFALLLLPCSASLRGGCVAFPPSLFLA